MLKVLAAAIVYILGALLIAAIFTVAYNPSPIYSPGIVTTRALDKTSLTMQETQTYGWNLLTQNQKNYRCTKFNNDQQWRIWYYEKFVAGFITKENYINFMTEVC